MVSVKLQETPIPSVYSINEDGKKRYFMIPQNGNHIPISEQEYNQVQQSKLKPIK